MANQADLASIIWPEISNRRQPKLNLPISSEPIADGLVAFANPATRFTAGLNKPAIQSGNAGYGLDNQGCYWKGAASNSPIDIGAPGGIGSILDQTKPWSFATRIYVSDTSTAQFFASDMDSAANNRGFELVVNVGYFGLYGYSGAIDTGVVWALPGVGIYDILAVYSGGASWTVTLYVNGILIGTSAASGSTQNAGTALRLCNPGTYTGGFGGLGNVYYFAIFRGDKSIYAKQLAINPWQLLIEPKNNLFIYNALGHVSLSGAAQAAGSATGAVTSQLALTGVSVSAATASGSLTSALALSGASASGSVANGDLMLTITMSGAAIASAAGVGQLLMDQSLAGASQSQAYAAGDLAGGSDLSGSAISQAAASGNLTLAITLSGASLSAALATAGLIADQPLTGSAQVSSSATGELIIAVPMSASATAYASGDGNLASIMPVSGASAAIVNAAGDLTVSIATDLSGSALAQILADGDIRISMPLSGAAIAQAMASAAATVSGAQAVIIDLAGHVAIKPALFGILGINHVN